MCNWTGNWMIHFQTVSRPFLDLKEVNYNLSCLEENQETISRFFLGGGISAQLHVVGFLCMCRVNLRSFDQHSAFTHECIHVYMSSCGLKNVINSS